MRRNNRTPPQDGFGRCPRGRSQPHRGLRQAHGEEDQCRREEGASPTRDTSPHSFSPGVSGFFHCGYVASTSPSPDAFGASMRASGARSRCARALSMRVTSMHRFSGRVAIARGDRNVVIARHPLSSRWWLVNARGFLRRADPNPYPPLPALTIQAFNARALRSGPRDLTVRLRFTARENPGGERVQATIPPPGVPPPATCPVTNQSRWCSGGRYPQDTLFSRRGARAPRALSWTSRLDNSRNRRDTAFPPRFRLAISAGCARGAPSRAAFGGTISRG